MVEINEIRKAYKTALESLGYEVYYEDAPKTANYPFLIFELVDSDYDGANTEIFDLYINGWDDSSSTVTLETLMNDALELINNKVYNPIEGLSFRAELDNRLNINDDENNLKRREYRFSLRTIL